MACLEPPRRCHPPLALRALVVLGSLLICPWAAATTYRWVDEQGGVHYSDTPPARTDKSAVLNQHGRVIKSPSAAATEQPSTTLAQQRRDQALLSTYVDGREIDLARDRALAIEQANLNSLQSRLQIVGQRLERLNQEAQGYRRADSKVPLPVQQMRSEAQAELLRISDEVARSSAQLERIRTRYAADRQRYLQLKGSLPAAAP